MTGPMPLMTICEIADAHAAVEAAAQRYWVEVLKPRVDACQTLEELNAIRNEVSLEAAGEALQMRDLPSAISVNLTLAGGRFLTRNTEGAQR